MTEEFEIEYQRDTLSIEDLDNALGRLWDELDADEKLSDEVRQAGLDPDELKRDYATLPIDVRSPSAGFDPVTITIVVAGVVAKDLWEKVLLPRIVARYGTNALREKGRKRREK